MWSLGVILYFLVSGVPPFYGESELEILEMVKRKEYTFNSTFFELLKFLNLKGCANRRKT